MADLGPVELLFVEFPGNQFSGEIAPALQELVEAGTIRVIDLVFVAKDADGNVAGIELEDLHADAQGVFDPLVEELAGLISDEDVEDLGEALEPNSSAAILLFENVWATKFRDAVVNSGGQAARADPDPAGRDRRSISRESTRRADRLEASNDRRFRCHSGDEEAVCCAPPQSSAPRRVVAGQRAAPPAAEVRRAGPGAVRRAAGRRGARRPQYVEAAPAEPDVSDELTKLAQLHTQGILTDEEFAAKKAQILGI